VQATDWQQQLQHASAAHVLHWQFCISRFTLAKSLSQWKKIPKSSTKLQQKRHRDNRLNYSKHKQAMMYCTRSSN